MKHLFTLALLLAFYGNSNAQNAPLAKAWITTPTAKTFNWIDWAKAPALLKEATKLVRISDTRTVHDFAQEVLADNEGSIPSVHIAVIDVNGDGILGIGLWAGSRGWCGSSGCAFELYDNGGMLSVELTDYELRPAKGGVKSSANRFFPLQRNARCPYKSAADVPAVFKPKS